MKHAQVNMNYKQFKEHAQVNMNYKQLNETCTC